MDKILLVVVRPVEKQEKASEAPTAHLSVKKKH
jgi:hypothetical protein